MPNETAIWLKEIARQLKIANRLEALKMKERYPDDKDIDEALEATSPESYSLPV